MNDSYVRWYWTAGAAPMVAVLVYALFLVLSYGRLPANVPVYFGFDGSPNGSMFRGLWTVLSPLILLCMVLLVLRRSPASRRRRLSAGHPSV